MMNSFGNTTAFIERTTHSLHKKNCQYPIFSEGIKDSAISSAVLFLLGLYSEEKRSAPKPCLILNKRSLKVKQPGDLCCPGGSISSPLDSILAKLLYVPGSPLTRWPHWMQWHKHHSYEAQSLALLFATCLRESVEEMRLNPLGVRFLGPLPSQQLVMFRKVIYPMVSWIGRQKRFFPNWEVERVVHIPLQNLLNPSHYARYRLHIGMSNKNNSHPSMKDYLCFVHKYPDGHEVLWGATFRITMVFLEIVFGFNPPAIESLPVVYGSLAENYLTGNG
jgi:hypothetical protein